MYKKNWIKYSFICLLVFIGFSSLLSIPKQGVQEPTNNTASIEQIEKQAFNHVNEYRKSLGLTQFVWNDACAEQARIHSKNMASGKVAFGHDGAAKRMKVVAKALNQMDGGAENVFECSDTYPDLAKEAFKGWLESEGHRENMVGNYNLSGMGVAIAKNGDYYFTQIFASGN